MKYRVKLINTETNETQLTYTIWNSKKKANEWCSKWNETVKNGAAIVGIMEHGKFKEV